ncbi:hypothetical protein Sste5346_005192 [Sporothrix stenoceras]|uniref:Ubiquitin 3 binding protein But2 C-terminal domain-containing protein n=1 Tax=Sporothrix stenoceras TaxID=5173 RepID=A0ABR3Z518_9PEZI
MKFSILALGLLAIDGAVASKCRPSKPASSSSAVSSVSSASSSVSSSSSLPAPSSSSAPISSSSSPLQSSSSSAVSSSPSSPVPSSSFSPTPSSSSIVASSSSSSTLATPSAPCTNLIVDGDFSDSLNGWTVSTQGTANSFGTYTCTPNYDNCGFMAVDNALDEVNIYQIVTFVPGVEYTFSTDYYLEELTTTPVSAQILCNFYALQGASPKRRSDDVSTVVSMSFTIDMHSEGATNRTISQRSPRPAARSSPASRRQTAPTFTNFHQSFVAPTSPLQYQLDCSFTASGPAKVSLAEMILQPAKCFTSFP